MKGVRGLYRGLVPHMWRDGPGNGIYMVIYEGTHPTKPSINNCYEMLNFTSDPRWFLPIHSLFSQEKFVYENTSCLIFECHFLFIPSSSLQYLVKYAITKICYFHVERIVEWDDFTSKAGSYYTVHMCMKIEYSKTFKSCLSFLCWKISFTEKMSLFFNLGFLKVLLDIIFFSF